MKRKRILLAVLILALVLSAGAGSAWAYFTTYAAAKGGYALHLGYRTEFQEEAYDGAKHIVIRYDDAGGENDQDVYVRVRAFGPEDGKHGLRMTGGDGWIEGTDGWYIYSLPLGPDRQESSELVIGIDGFSSREEIKKFEEGESFNVAVVYECAPVMYETDGTAVPPEDPRIWSQQLVVKTGTSGEGGN